MAQSLKELCQPRQPVAAATAAATGEEEDHDAEDENGEDVLEAFRTKTVAAPVFGLEAASNDPDLIVETRGAEEILHPLGFPAPSISELIVVVVVVVVVVSVELLVYKTVL